MEIKLPENPYLYLILVGIFFMVSVFVIVAIEGERTVGGFLIIGMGAGLFAWGWVGLKESHDLNQRKKQKEVELVEAQIHTTEMDTLLKKIGRWKP